MCAGAGLCRGCYDGWAAARAAKGSERAGLMGAGGSQGEALESTRIVDLVVARIRDAVLASLPRLPDTR